MWYIGTNKGILAILKFCFPQDWALFLGEKKKNKKQKGFGTGLSECNVFLLILQIKPSVA